MRVRAVATAEAGGRGGGGGVRIALLAAVVIAVLLAGVMLLGAIRETVLLSSPDVREAQARQSVAEANYRTARLARETRSADAQAATEASWQPVVTGAGRLAVVALLVAVPVGLAAVLMGGVFMFRRRMSLPTSDGRAPLVGFDRELSAEALFRYQALQGRGASFEALPMGRSRRDLEGFLVDRERAAPRLDLLDGAGDQESES